MKAQVIVEQVSRSADRRGWVMEPINEQQLAGQRNTHVALTEPGAIRGNHFHRHSTEIFVITGPGLVRWREDGVGREVQVPAEAAMRFTVPPGIPHAMKNTGDRPMLLVAFSTAPHDPANPDTQREVLIES